MAIAHRAIAMNGVRDPYVVRMPNGLSLTLAITLIHMHIVLVGQLNIQTDEVYNLYL